jgi:hypothetical protein
VLDWWRQLFQRRSNLGGALRTGRQKTYSAESGYVYQYVLSSFRQHRRGGEDLHEYTFQVSGGRGESSTLTVVLRSSVLREWIRRHDREFSASERYGIAKIALKRQFDSAESPAAIPASVAPDIDEVAEISGFLGL